MADENNKPGSDEHHNEGVTNSEHLNKEAQLLDDLTLLGREEHARKQSDEIEYRGAAGEAAEEHGGTLPPGWVARAGDGP